MGIELNGNYYHSDVNGNKDKQYHINKTIIGKNNGIKLIHIFEDEFINKLEIVKSRIRNILNITPTKIFARKCIIKEVNKLDSKKFINENHIQGNCIDLYRFGLFYNNDLVSLMTFGNRRNSLGSKVKNQGEFEMTRFYNKINTNVIGSFSKLLNYFVINYSPSSIITFADIRWSGINPENTVYYKTGFTFVGNTPPNYWYVKINNFLNRQHRFSYRKDILVKEGYSVDKTEWEIMQERGFDRIWDCGSMKFELKF